MNTDSMKVGDIIPFLLISYFDKAFRWAGSGIHHTNQWRIGQIVRVDGNTLRIKDLLTDSDEVASISHSYLKECLRVVDNMKLVECMAVFAAQQAVNMRPATQDLPVQQPIKIEVKDTKTKVLELNEHTKYVAIDENGENYKDYDSADKTLDEWKEYFVREFDEDDLDLEDITFYAETKLRLNLRKIVEVSID